MSNLISLNNATAKSMHALSKETRSYDRSELEPGLVHIGLGNFHRAHFLSCLNKLLISKSTRMGVQEIDVINPSPFFEDKLKKQDYLYTLLEKSSDGSERLNLMNPIMGYTNGAQHPQEAIDILSSPTTQLVSLTVTEKGYCYDEAKHSLDWSNPNIVHDLKKNEQSPLTVIGFLGEALFKRYSESRAPLTILSCDNIPKNGKVLQSCVMDFCTAKNQSIIPWIQDNVSFPCTMVDRITPKTTQEDLDEHAIKFGFIDELGVHCEDFFQWIIQDDIRTAIPNFTEAGAQIVNDVVPYELMKIRLLNGSHSALAYMSYLLGYRQVDRVLNDTDISQFIRKHYMEELTYFIPSVPAVDLNEYKDVLMSRFSNPYIKDTLLRLAHDGSKKIANAIIKPLQEALQNNLPYSSMTFALASWIRFLQGYDEERCEIPIEDCNKEELIPLALNIEKNPRSFLRFLGTDNVSESKMDEVCQLLLKYYRTISTKGVRKSLEEFLAK